VRVSLRVAEVQGRHVIGARERVRWMSGGVARKQAAEIQVEHSHVRLRPSSAHYTRNTQDSKEMTLATTRFTGAVIIAYGCVSFH
jgi:hypothetical protein